MKSVPHKLAKLTKMNAAAKVTYHIVEIEINVLFLRLKSVGYFVVVAGVTRSPLKMKAIARSHSTSPKFSPMNTQKSSNPREQNWAPFNC